jgi:hypothetical protein
MRRQKARERKRERTKKRGSVVGKQLKVTWASQLSQPVRSKNNFRLAKIGSNWMIMSFYNRTTGILKAHRNTYRQSVATG